MKKPVACLVQLANGTVGSVFVLALALALKPMSSNSQALERGSCTLRSQAQERLLGSWVTGHTGVGFLLDLGISQGAFETQAINTPISHSSQDCHLFGPCLISGTISELTFL